MRLMVPPPQGCDSLDDDEVTGLRSAKGTIAGGPVISTMRNRNLVTEPTVLLVNLLRISSVQELPLPLRTRFGAKALETQVATSDALMVLLR